MHVKYIYPSVAIETVVSRGSVSLYPPLQMYSVGNARGHTRIDPIDPRIPHERGHGAVLGVEGHDGIRLEVTGVDEAVAVGVAAVAPALLAVIANGTLGHDLRRRALGAQQRGRRAEEVAGREWRPKQRLAVRRQGDAVGSDGKVSKRGACLEVDGLAPYVGHELGIGSDRPGQT